ncbi:MAG TPA: VOC family protein [Gemmatimonadaceae bacterium]|jgi:catechol 2,3-dioxygenase-like lactoylglutathione lyase family enzyme
MTTATESAVSTGAVPALTGFHHLGLTVRDIAASEAFYGKALGLVRAFVEPHSAGDGYAVVMVRPGDGLVLGLDYHPEADGAVFDPRRTGLDHLAIRVNERADIDTWVAHLDAIGIEHGQVFSTEEPLPHALMTFRDPDGIPIELFWLGG